MAEEEKVQSSEPTSAATPPAAPAETVSTAEEDLEGQPLTPKEILNISYVVLFIAGVFIINAMDGFSPWAIGIVLAVIGAAIFTYGQYKRWGEKQTPVEGQTPTEASKPDSAN